MNVLRMLMIIYVLLLTAVGCGDTSRDVVSWEDDPIHGYRYGRNADDQIIETHSVGPDGEPAADAYGVWIKRFVRDDAGNALEEAYFDPDGNPVACFGVHLMRSEFDGQGRRTRMELYGADGELIGPDRAAVHRYEYDDAENAVTWSTYDSHGELYAFDGSIAVHRTVYDGNDRDIEHAYYGVDGEPTTDARGAHIVQFSYDDNDYPVKMRFLDPERMPACDHTGISTQVWEYDERGNVVWEAFYDEGGAPALGIDRAFAWATDWDQQSRTAERRRCDESGQLSEDGDGIAVRRWEYVDDENKVVLTHFNEAYEPATDSDGAYGWQVLEDESGMTLERTALDADGVPTVTVSGYATVRYIRDERGVPIDVVHLDLEGREFTDFVY